MTFSSLGKSEGLTFPKTQPGLRQISEHARKLIQGAQVAESQREEVLPGQRFRDVVHAFWAVRLSDVQPEIEELWWRLLPQAT